MGLHPQNIGAAMPHGFAGSYARQPDMIVNTRPAGGAVPIPFGSALAYDVNGAVVPMGTGSTADSFAGVAAREIKTTLSYLDQSAGSYAPGEAVPVFQRGAVSVMCGNGVPKLGGKVYVRVAANESIPSAAVGGFEAAADGSNTVELTNCQWAGPADSNRIAELRIMTLNNA